MHIVKNYDELNISSERKIVLDLIETALESIQPENVFKNNVKLNGNILSIKGKTYNLGDYNRIFLLGFGKGSAENSKIIEAMLSDKLTAGYVIDLPATANGALQAGTQEEEFSKIQFTLGTHPIISEENIEFTEKVMRNFTGLAERDLVIVVVCGGGSAMFEHPHSITLAQKIQIEKALLKSGADITEINTIRQHLSDVKGGGLSKIMYPAKIVTLIFSDVPGNDLRFIASGPTVKNDTTIDDALDIIKKYSLEKDINLPREAFIDNPHDDKYFENIENFIVLSNVTVLDAIENKAKLLGLSVIRYSDRLKGDTKDVAKELLENSKDKSLLIAAGETTVKVTGNGKGGRNQQLALEALKILNDNTYFASVDSDGWDFTDTAGAIVDIKSKQKAEELNLNIDDYLLNNDSYTFFQKINSQVITGRLSSNVSDFMIVLKT